MKNSINTLVSIILLTGLISCSTSSSSEVVSIPEDNTIPTTYFPLKTANFWTYRVENQASNNTPATTNTPASSFRDSLYVANDTLINAIVYKKMKTLNMSNGFFSSVLKDNGLRIDGTRLKATGTLDNSSIAGISIPINLVDFVILKDNAAAGNILSTTSGVINLTASGTPITVNYVLTSVSDGILAAFTSNSINYTNVKKTKIILNLTITGLYSGFQIPIMNTQDVVTATLYFAPLKGMIYNKRILNYELNPALPAALVNNLAAPTKSYQVQEEFLDTFNVSH